MPPNSSSPSPRWSTLARPGAMTLGTLLLCWRDRAAHWPWGLLIVSFALLSLALISPSAYSPIDRGLKFLQTATVRIFSWAMLLIVFLFIFVPGRWILRSRARAIFRHGKMDTYWIDSPTPSDSTDFQRQF